MAENNTNDPKAPVPPAGAAKVPLVKRVKIPTVRPAAPEPQPAAAHPQPGQPPAAVKPAQPAKPAAATENSAPAAPRPEEAAAPETITDPAARVEASHAETKEPELPPDEKGAAVPSPVEAEEIEKAPPRKRRREAASSSPSQADLAKQKTEEQLRKAKEKAKHLWSNKLYRFGFLGVLLVVICYTVYSSLPMLAEKKLPDIFAANGMPFKSFKMKLLTMDTMELTNVSDKTGTMTIANMKFNYSLFSLVSSNTIKSVELSGVNVNGIRRDDGISLGALGDLISSPMSAKKGMELTINSLKISNGHFILKSDKPLPEYDEDNPDEEPVDDTIVVNFTANGTLSKAGLNMQVATDYTSDQMVVKTATALNKTARFSQIKTDITEGNLLKGEESIGSVTGAFEVSVDSGVLSKGTADLVLSSSSQKLTLKADVIPQETGFDLSVHLDRSFENPQDAIGKFVGDLSIEANNMTMSGTFQKFSGTLPLKLSSNSLTNSKMAVQELKSEVSVKFSCEGPHCIYKLENPMKLSFNSFQNNGMFKQIKLFEPLSLTIGPDPKDPFLESNGGVLSFSLPISSFATKALIADSRSSEQIAVALNGIKARLKYNVFSGGYSGDMVFTQSGFADKNLRMTGIQGSAAFTSASLPSARLRIANVSMTKPDVLPDFSTDIILKPMGGAELGVDSTIRIQNGVITASVKGSYSLADREWKMYVVIPKFALSETGVSLPSVLPFMSAYLPPSTSGVVGMKGRVSVKDGRIDGPVNLLLENVKTEWKGMQLTALNGVLTLSSIYPLETPANQQLFVGVFNIGGIPFQNALFNFRVLGNQGIEVSNVRMKYADGQFKTIKSFYFPYEGHASQILFEGSGINLSAVSESLKSSALQVDGVMNSEWRMSFVDEKLMIDSAAFTSRLPGTLHFETPADLRDKMNPEMQSFLSNVIIKNMSVKASGPIDGMVRFDVTIDGHSPLETDAENQEVSFDFSGSFRNMLKQEERPFEIPSDILLSLQDYAK